MRASAWKSRPLSRIFINQEKSCEGWKSCSEAVFHRMCKQGPRTILHFPHRDPAAWLEPYAEYPAGHRGGCWTLHLHRLQPARLRPLLSRREGHRWDSYTHTETHSHTDNSRVHSGLKSPLRLTSCLTHGACLVFQLSDLSLLKFCAYSDVRLSTSKLKSLTSGTFCMQSE